MTTIQKREEARDASLVFHALLIDQGFKAVAETLDSFDDVQPVPGRTAASGGRWLARVLSSLMKRRGAVGRLAAAYYRYLRALHTGYTYPPLAGEAGDTASLNELRDDFFSQVEDLSPELLNDDRELVDPDGVIVTYKPPSKDEDVEIEEPDTSLADLLDELDDDEDEIRDELYNSAVVVLDNKIEEIDDDAPAAKSDELREEAHDQAAARAASAAERVTQNGGRDLVANAGRKDRRAIGYVRVSGTGHPCGFCAMLISRGSQLYYNADAAGGKTKSQYLEGTVTGDEWHPNCHCYIEPIFSVEQYEEDSRFDLNRELEDLWPTVTRGLRSKKALARWRQYIRNDWTPQSPGGAESFFTPTDNAQEA